MTGIFLLLMLCYILTFLLLHILVLDKPFSLVTSICLYGDTAAKLHPATSIASLAPTIIFPTISLVFDTFIVRFIRDQVKPVRVNKGVQR